MRRIICICSLLLALAGCTSFDDRTPYADELLTLSVRALWPEGYEACARGGVRVTAREFSSGNSYAAVTDGRGCVRFEIPRGIYRIAIADRTDGAVFNGALEEVRLVAGDLDLALPLVYSKAGSIIFKEIYCGGCPMLPFEGTLQHDQYFVLHNNDTETQYLDGLCFGCLDPYTSAGTNNWVTTGGDGQLVFREFAPMNVCIWCFGGAGSDFPLAPGEDAVVAVRGAVDFTAEFPLSVDLNREEYFACFSRLHFSNEALQLSPGDRIRSSHLLEVLKKVGTSTAYTLAMQSPAVVIFRPEAGFDFDEYLADDSRCLERAPGSTLDCIKIPWEWVLDGVEVFYSTNNNKRIPPAVDAGAFAFSVTGQGRSIHRRVDEEATAQNGFEVFVDTNNSSEDFYERMTASLHESL